MLKPLVVLALGVAGVSGDLRRASQPENAWKVQQRSHENPFQQRFALYMEPSDFGYDGLKKQRDGGGYDNFLRSNIDNEQDKRNFNTEDGEDHLPFRSFQTAFTDAHKSVKNKMVKTSPDAVELNEQAGNYVSVKPGVPFVVPLRWNNPHSSEIEVNIWVMNKKDPYVIPILKPTCSGEGYQDQAFTFTVPSDFNSVASCRNVGDCVLQVYAHSVESRMYSSGTPVVVEGGTGKWAPGTIKPAEIDSAFALSSLRRLCLPSSDPNKEANHKYAVVYKARLSSDQYNHAYQNSDFSPYAGQQPQFISQNLQAACILKMATGNFGELGKEYMQKVAPEARQYANELQKMGNNYIRSYETIANSIIEAISSLVANNNTHVTAVVPAGSTLCTEWRDNFDKVAGGKKRGKDQAGGHCTEGLTCLCHQDCKGGFGQDDAEGEDAYCARLKVDGTLKADGTPTGFKKISEGSEAVRIKAAQQTTTCFRCAETGSTVTHRHNTNTYIPSFEVQGKEAVEIARQYVAPIYLKNGFMTNPVTGAVTQKGDQRAIVQIYMAALTELWPKLKMASDGSYLQAKYSNAYKKLEEPKAESLERYKFTYRGPVLKDTLETLSDANGGNNQQYKKLDAKGKEDKGFYSAEKAWALQARNTGSSIAIPITAGPLNGKIPSSVNMHGMAGVPFQASGGGTTVFKLPPPEAPLNSCSMVLSALNRVGEITDKGVDMNGLNADADCDSDVTLTQRMNEEAAACLVMQLTDAAYQCPPYTEPECHIPGENGLLPTQMFSNFVSAAGNTVPSFVAVLFVAALLL